MTTVALCVWLDFGAAARGIAVGNAAGFAIDAYVADGLLVVIVLAAEAANAYDDAGHLALQLHLDVAAALGTGDHLLAGHVVGEGYLCHTALVSGHGEGGHRRAGGHGIVSREGEHGLCPEEELACHGLCPSLVVGRRALEEDGLLVVGADADLVALVEPALRVVGGDGVAAGGGLERAYGEVDAHGVGWTGDGEVIVALAAGEGAHEGEGCHGKIFCCFHIIFLLFLLLMIGGCDGIAAYWTFFTLCRGCRRAGLPMRWRSRRGRERSGCHSLR